MFNEYLSCCAWKV